MTAVKTPTLRGEWVSFFCAIAALVLLVALGGYVQLQSRLLLAPMIGGLDSCLFEKKQLVHDSPQSRYTKLCEQDPSSASQLVRATLEQLGGPGQGNHQLQLGYTLYVPLLKLFTLEDGQAKLNDEAIGRVVNTIKNTPNRVVLYLFSNHFGTGSPLEDHLAQNPENLLQSRLGPLPKDRYYSVGIYPWSFANTANEITHLRKTAIEALLGRLCADPATVANKIHAVTLLGELHHLFPDFSGGMGFNGEYLITDYSPSSVSQFQAALETQFHTVAALNQQLGSHFKSFADIHPPSKNIRKDPLQHYWEHIDAFAGGLIPINGWVAERGKAAKGPSQLHFYLDGHKWGSTSAAFGRQDVLEAHPSLPSANVGWSYLLDYRKVPAGLHTLSILLEGHDGNLSVLGERQLAIMDASQSSPQKVATLALPPVSAIPQSTLFNIDSPAELSDYYFNPLVPLWHEFRKSQVTRYLDYFSKLVHQTCIPASQIYSHQILPFVNPGWDENKFAVGHDLAVPGSLRLGISLYGEASYGHSFFDWFGDSAQTQKHFRNGYGITEFHPLKAMPSQELREVFLRHRNNHATFLSFFLESEGLSEDPKSKPNLFSFDLKNPHKGSDVLYQSTREALR